ncbi:MAG: hypothetical protein IKX83_03940 [Clostridia bacterium]|nr:hypothetical protein [Clostridia bacterium]
MASEKKPKKIILKASRPEEHTSDLFETVPDNEWTRAEQKAREEKEKLDYEPAPESDMDFMTEEEEKTKKKNRTIGVIIGLLLASLLIGGFLYHNTHGKINDAQVSTTVSTSRLTTKPGSLEPSELTTRSYVTKQLTVHRDQNGVWRSYAGLEQTVGYTGVVGNDTGWWYVENDVVNFKYNGIASNDYGSWLIENGKVNLKYTGEYVYDGHLYYIREGRVIKSERLTTTKPVSTTSATKTQSTTGTTGTTASTTAKCDHKWVAVYDGNAIVMDMSRFCKCPECGLNFQDRELLESHAYAMDHKLSADPADDVYNTGDQKEEVIVGYTNSDNTYWVCTICGVTTKNADEVNVGM